MKSKLNFFSFFNEILQNRLLIIAKLGATFSAIDGILANLLARYEEESERRERERENYCLSIVYSNSFE